MADMGTHRTKKLNDLDRKGHACRVTVRLADNDLVGLNAYCSRSDCSRSDAFRRAIRVLLD